MPHLAETTLAQNVVDTQKVINKYNAGPYGVKCPSCGSNPGRDCYGGGPMRSPHPQRYPSPPTVQQTQHLLDYIQLLEDTLKGYESELSTLEG